MVFDIEEEELFVAYLVTMSTFGFPLCSTCAARRNPTLIVWVTRKSVSKIISRATSWPEIFFTGSGKLLARERLRTSPTHGQPRQRNASMDFLIILRESWKVFRQNISGTLMRLALSTESSNSSNRRIILFVELKATNDSRNNE